MNSLDTNSSNWRAAAKSSCGYPLTLVLLLIVLLPPSLLALPAGTTPALSPERAVLRTSAGDLLIAFYPGVAPASVAKITALIDQGVYNGSKFTYVNPGFVAQLDLSTQANPTPLFAAEFNAGVHHHRGTISLARDPEVADSARGSLFFALKDLPELDGRYTVVGEVVDGLSALGAIEKAPTEGDFKPIADIEVTGSALAKTAGERFTLALAKGKPVAAPESSAADPSYGQVDGRVVPSELSQLMLYSLLAVVLVSLLGFVLVKRLGPTVFKSCAVAAILVATPPLLAYFTPELKGQPIGSAVLLLAVLGLVWLLGRFESGRAVS